MTIADPKVEFTPWAPWRDRGRLKTKDGETWGGAYMLARFQELPDANALRWPNLPREIIYVGEAKDLNKRPLTQHNRTDRYHEMFGDWDNNDLFVSVCHIYPTYGTTPPLLRVFASHLEAKICWDYAKKFGKPVAMHFKEKEGAPKKKRKSSKQPVKSVRRKKKKRKE